MPTLHAQSLAQIASKPSATLAKTDRTQDAAVSRAGWLLVDGGSNLRRLLAGPASHMHAHVGLGVITHMAALPPTSAQGGGSAGSPSTRHMTPNKLPSFDQFLETRWGRR